MRKTTVRSFVAAVALAAVVLLPTSSAFAATPLQVIGTDFQLSRIPASLKSGTYSLDFYNRSRTEAHEVVVLRPTNAHQSDSDSQLIANLDVNGTFDFEGVAYALALKSQVGRTATLAAGRTIFVCTLIDPATGTPHYKLGMIEFRTVA